MKQQLHVLCHTKTKFGTQSRMKWVIQGKSLREQSMASLTFWEILVVFLLRSVLHLAFWSPYSTTEVLSLSWHKICCLQIFIIIRRSKVYFWDMQIRTKSPNFGNAVLWRNRIYIYVVANAFGHQIKNSECLLKVTISLRKKFKWLTS